MSEEMLTRLTNIVQGIRNLDIPIQRRALALNTLISSINTLGDSSGLTATERRTLYDNEIYNFNLQALTSVASAINTLRQCSHK